MNMYGVIERNNLYFIEDDNSYSEVFQYIKELWIFLILIFIAVKKKIFPYVIWSLLFLYLLFDDSLSLHENIGEYLSNYFEIQSGLGIRSVDFGELIVSFSVGISFTFFLVLGYLKSNKTIKKVFQHLSIFILLLAFFGVFIDILHVFFNDNNKLGLFEDGGEMIVMSIILAYVFNLLDKNFNLQLV
ncbi:hypothetical protein A8C32_03850 [Flavivirga aquatica]|uniref:Uncharacterized protein n=1 Tax=Flavivirga aquatica TaxID=1849968 RepID=A0A1E5TB33_9FLAO|nr:hypothetical protein [Flavivirga aquatica]OEK08593.1 hypothetical protein A8C32_03850 [Flavivirga aquatica]